jgi:hypothetical protein
VNRQKKIALAGVGVLVVGVGVALAWRAGFAPDEHEQMVAELKAMPIPERFEKFRDESLTEEQRDELRRSMREVMEEDMTSRMDEYFNAPEDQKVAILDKHIDEFQEMRERFRQRREADEQAGADGQDSGRGRRDPNAPDRADSGERSSQPGEGERRGPFNRQPPTREQRKERMEGSSPERTARMSQYFMKMRERAKERGIEMRGPGMRGGGGGGRGGI